MIDLRKERESRNLSQSDLAEMCNVRRSTISMIECGTNKPSVKLAKKIGKIFGIEWYNFF